MKRSNNLQIRQATAADVSLIKQLAQQAWEPAYCQILSKEQIAYMLELIYQEEALLKQMQEGQEFRLLFAEQEPIGFAAFSPKDVAAGLFKLNKIYLLPQAKGKGAGQKLLEAVETELKARGARVLELNVNRQNTAINFYEARGYAIIREEDIPIGPYWMNDYVMQKEL